MRVRASIQVNALVHYVDPEENGPYGYTLCKRTMVRSPDRPYSDEKMAFLELTPATCLWCVAGRLFSTDVGF